MRMPGAKITDVLEDVNDHAARLSEAHAKSVDAIERMARDSMEELSVTLAEVRRAARSVADAADAHGQTMNHVTDLLTSIVLGLAVGYVIVYGSQAVRDVARKFFG